MKFSNDSVIVYGVFRQDHNTGSALNEKAVFVSTAHKNSRFNTNFVEKLKADIVKNPDKYGPSAQTVGTDLLFARALTSAFKDKAAETVARYVEKLGTSVDNNGWNL